MATSLQIDFISDVVCPWCAIGFHALEQALANTRNVVTAQITFKPFELNPDMPPQGQNIVEHVAQKYGLTPEQSLAARENIRLRAAELDFTISTSSQDQIYNTFDAHRLLHWAALLGAQRPLKAALFKAYFTDSRDPSDKEVLVAVADEIGLDPRAARAMLFSGRYAEDIRQEERLSLLDGVSIVPTIVIDGTYTIHGGHPPKALERALLKIAADGANA